ncbi:MAG: hypothetical protein JXR78_03635 [Victivallales bacterium]|nr:hypothetical protein [Victivallales bacterium]
MTRLILLFLGILITALPVWANDDFNKLRIVSDTAIVERPKVEDKADNVIISTRDAGKNLTNTKTDSLAYAIADRTHSYFWEPKWQYFRTNGVWLPKAACSHDKSIVAIIENTGSGAGPRGSRLVLINTFNWRTVRIIDFPEEELIDLCFIPDSTRAIAYMRRQQVLEQKEDRLYDVDLSGAEKPRALLAPQEGHGNMIATGRYFLIKPDNATDIYRYDNRNGLVYNGKIKSAPSKIHYAIAEDQRTVAIAETGKVKIYDSLNDVITHTLPLPDGFIPDSVTFAGCNDLILVCAQGRNPILFDGIRRNELSGSSNGMSLYDPLEKTLFIQMIERSTLMHYHMPELIPQKGVSPSKLRPKNRGRIVFMDFLPGRKLVMLSSFGDLIEFCLENKTVSGGRSRIQWNKSIVISAKE